MFGNNVADAGISACTFQLAGVTCPPAWRVNGWACKHFLLSQGVQCLDQSRLWLLSNYDYLSTIYCHFQEHRGRPENEGMVQNFPGSLTSGPKTEWMIIPSQVSPSEGGLVDTVHQKNKSFVDTVGFRSVVVIRKSQYMRLLPIVCHKKVNCGEATMFARKSLPCKSFYEGLFLKLLEIQVRTKGEEFSINEEEG